MLFSTRTLTVLLTSLVLGACTMIKGERADMVRNPDSYDQTSHIVHQKDSGQMAGIVAIPAEAVAAESGASHKEGTASVSYGKPQQQ